MFTFASAQDTLSTSFAVDGIQRSISLYKKQVHQPKVTLISLVFAFNKQPGKKTFFQTKVKCTWAKLNVVLVPVKLTCAFSLPLVSCV